MKKKLWLSASFDLKTKINVNRMCARAISERNKRKNTRKNHIKITTKANTKTTTAARIDNENNAKMDWAKHKIQLTDKCQANKNNFKKDNSNNNNIFFSFFLCFTKWNPFSCLIRVCFWMQVQLANVKFPKWKIV